MPLTPYPVQEEMMRAIATTLTAGGCDARPVVATEVPTGCGKTVALLSSVLEFQAGAKRMTSKEADRYFLERAYSWRCEQTPGDARASSSYGELSSEGQIGEQTTTRRDRKSKRGSAAADDGASGWTPPAVFFKQFRVARTKRLRVEIDPTGSSELRRRFVPPPCTLFYATRTHAQLRQTLQELRKLKGAEELVRMNVLGSREHYCINRAVNRAKGNALPVEGNNLGEVCDKLVSVGQCEAVNTYGELAARAIEAPLPGRRGLVWDLEDLVQEGVAQNSCPYYAARDLVFYADINFCTYSYLLDPIIRHECKMESAIKNHSIVVFDEAHNVPSVCQQALSVSMSPHVFTLFAIEFHPLLPTGSVGAAERGALLSYPRDFTLSHYTLAELFAFLSHLFELVRRHFHSMPVALPTEVEGRGETAQPYTLGTATAAYLRTGLRAFMQQSGLLGRGGRPQSQDCWFPLFREAYGVVMSLGVTFNPFQFSIFGLSMMKRWLLVLRFLLQKPDAFALSSKVADGAVASVEEDAIMRHMASVGVVHSRPHTFEHSSRATTGPQTPQALRCEVRCLDGSLAFHHLLRGTHRVILASGTLSPFSQLAHELGLTASQWNTLEGLHVVQRTQYQLNNLGHLPSHGPLRCTFSNLQQASFMAGLASVMWCLIRSVPTGGVLIFAPNYSVMRELHRLTQSLSQQDGKDRAEAVLCLLEPRKTTELTPLLEQFKATAVRRTIVLFAVYRGKVSEGIDFTDDMARLVVCLGVPLQPLKSWTVRAQRAYSGPDWYTTDAVRAVNQAMGRCLRHVRDFGAVVLLDERYAQPDHQRQLSRWCRDALHVRGTLGDLTASLSSFFNQAMADRVKPADAREREPRDQPHGNPCAGGGGWGPVKRAALLGTEQIPFARLSRAVPSEKREPLPPTSHPSDSVPPARPAKHPWAATAMKLLCEAADRTSVITAADLRAAVRELEDGFPAEVS